MIVGTWALGCLQLFSWAHQHGAGEEAEQLGLEPVSICDVCITGASYTTVFGNDAITRDILVPCYSSLTNVHLLKRNAVSGPTPNLVKAESAVNKIPDDSCTY